MYKYRAYNYATGEVWEHTCSSRAIACRAGYKSAIRMARENIREGYGTKEEPLVRLFEVTEKTSFDEFREIGLLLV